MARIARIVIPDIPHHVVQRGNRRQNVFFRDGDKQKYIEILREQAERFRLTFWAYCLMDNHVHLIAVPHHEDSLAKGIGEAHRRYTRMVNFREGWRGYLWQGRFNSFPLDEQYLVAAVRYVERNPVRAKMVEKADEYLWSSAKAHISKTKDPLLENFYLIHEINDWASYLAENDEENVIRRMEVHSRTGRPLGSKAFIENLERRLGIVLQKRKPGPKGNN